MAIWKVFGLKEDSAVKRSNIVLGIAALSCALAVSGCNPFRALPGNYKDPIILNENGSKTDVYNNLMSQLYDQIAEGKNDRVHEEVLNIIANDQFGKYEELEKLYNSGTDAEYASFVEAHKAIYKHSDDETAATQKERVRKTYERIRERVHKVFYDEIKSGSYTDRSKFYEQRLAMAHYADLYDIENLVKDGKVVDSWTVEENGTPVIKEWYEKYIDNTVLKETDVSKYIHLENYTDYINRKIIPTIMRDLLVEQYLYDYDQNTTHILGRAYGRKVNIVKIADESKYPNAATGLVDAFAAEYITAKEADDSVDFEQIADVWRGFKSVNEDGTVKGLDSYDLATSAGLHVCDINSLKAISAHTDDPAFYAEINTRLGTGFKYVKESKLGILLEKYVLIDENNRFASDDAKSALTEFTSSLTYSKEDGLAMKIAELGNDDYTTDGWYVKNGGLTELPDAIRNRLFNINVATEVDHMEKMEKSSTTAAEHTIGDYEPTNYVRYINGHYYLTPETAERFEDNPHSFVIYEGGASYIVEVVEAVTTSKLDTKTGKDSYNELRESDVQNNPLFAEEIAMEIAHVLGSKDTYVKDAYQHYIEQYNLVYHSTALYDYFKEKYPDLFED